MNPFDSDLEERSPEEALKEVKRARNKQLYPNSPLSVSSVDTDWEENPDRLFNAKKPNFAILHETPRHRLAVYLKAQGHSNRFIAERLNMTEPWVSQILRQPWAQERMVAELREAGRDAITTLLQGAAYDSVQTLIEIRDDPEASPQARVNSSNSLLDRLYGKPTQRVEAFNTNTVRDFRSTEEMDARLAELEREEARLTGRMRNAVENEEGRGQVEGDQQGDGAGARVSRDERTSEATTEGCLR